MNLEPTNKKEPVNSKRIQVINFLTEGMHEDVASINEALVDREGKEVLDLIEQLRDKLTILKDRVINGDIV